MVKIFNINEKKSLLESVIKLGDANSATLGFLPRGAFDSVANDGRILVAVDKNDNLLGYLLYGIKRSANLINIVHLCVNQSERGQGIAKALFNELKETTKYPFSGIRVHCRRDYEVNKLWPKLGFVAVGEKDGRSKEGSKLTIWWFDYEHPSLFTFANEQYPTSRLIVAIDANIFIDLQDPPSSSNEESHSLLADWLQEDVELCLTSEIFNEINRNKNEEERKKKRSFTSTFTILDSPNDKFQAACIGLQPFFSRSMSQNDESDLRQLARSIAAEVQFFVTRDERLLKKSEQVYDEFGLQLIRPSYLIIHQDALTREVEYQPARLAGAFINIERVNSEQSSLLTDVFFNPKQEKKAKFRNKLQRYLVDPHRFELSTVSREQQPLALIIYGRENQSQLDVPLLRVLPGRLSGTLARYLVLRTITVCSGEGRLLTKITDNQLSNEIKDALKENGFIFKNGCWIKANVPFIGTSQDFLVRLTSLSKEFQSEGDYFTEIANFIERANKFDHIHDLLKAERTLWPAKFTDFTDLELPTFMVAIQPEWAMHLFDAAIARQDMFGGDPNLILKAENVYYRASKPKILRAPARILWYVSKGNRNYQGSMSIRACSYLDEVIIDKCKPLFSRFKRLGVYKWQDVIQIARNDMDKNIMAFRFSNTELFKTPVSRKVLQEMWLEETGKQFDTQSPRLIPSERFFRIYNMGMKSQ